MKRKNNHWYRLVIFSNILLQKMYKLVKPQKEIYSKWAYISSGQWTMYVIRLCEVFTEPSIFPMGTKKLCTDPHRTNLNPARPCKYKYIWIFKHFSFFFFLCMFQSTLAHSTSWCWFLVFIPAHRMRKWKKEKLSIIFQTDLAAS